MSLASKYARILREAFGDELLIHEENDAKPATETKPLVARGDSLLDEGEGSPLKSPIANVPDDRWNQFVRCLAQSACDAVSASNAVGMFQMTPRRLADLSVVACLSRKKADNGKTVWVAIFLPPLTSAEFLSSPGLQYEVFCNSMKDYADKMESGELVRDPWVSMSSALAILHKCGPSGLKTWSSGDRFPATEKLVDRVAGIF